MEKEDVLLAITISHEATNWQPAAAATPLTLATTGTGRRCRDSIKCVHWLNTFWWYDLPSLSVWKQRICTWKNYNVSLVSKVQDAENVLNTSVQWEVVDISYLQVPLDCAQQRKLFLVLLMWCNAMMDPLGWQPLAAPSALLKRGNFCNIFSTV